MPRIELRWPLTDDRLREQISYLEGVLWADPTRRQHGDPDDIDPLTDGTCAFWRGLLETAGYIAILAAGGGDRVYPRIDLRAGYPILMKLISFIEGRLRPSLTVLIGQGRLVAPAWDEDGSVAERCATGIFRVTGAKAQQLCRILYPPDSTVGRESIRERVDQILTWTPRR